MIEKTAYFVILIFFVALIAHWRGELRYGFGEVDDLQIGPRYVWVYFYKLRMMLGKWALIINWVIPHKSIYRNLIYWERKENKSGHTYDDDQTLDKYDYNNDGGKQK